LYANTNSVHDVAINARQLYAATGDGVLVWDLASGTLLKHWTFRDGLTNNHTTAVAYCPIGAPPVIIGTQRGLDLYDPQSDQWQHLTRESGALHGSTVQALACDVKNGRGLIGYASDGLDIFDAKAGKIRHLGSADGLVSDQVTALAYVAAANETWVGSPFGVSVITDKGITNYDKAQGKMPDQDIRAIAGDAAGNVWLGAYSGLVKYTHGAWKLYSDKTIPDFISSIGGIALAPDGTLWLAGVGGDLCHFDPSSEKCLAGPRSPDNVSFWSRVAVDTQGKAYFGSDRQGVTILDGNSTQQLMLKDSPLASNNVQAIAEDKSGRVWLLTNKGAYRVDPADEKAKWESFTSDNSGLASSAANVLYADPRGGIWFGGYDGASFFDGTAWKHITRKDNGLLDDDIRAFAIDAQGRIWFGGPKGLSVWDGKTATNFNKQAGLPDEDVQALLADGAIVWAGTREGGLLRFEGGK